MSLAQALYPYIAACFTGIWIESHEHEDAIAEIRNLCREHEWSCASWDLDRGLRVVGQGELPSPTTTASDPVAALRAVNSLAGDDTTSLLVLPNFHRLLGSAELIQALAHQVALGKQNRTFVIILAPVVQLPIELEKHFVVIEHALPDRDQLTEIARGIATEDGELPDGDELERVLDAAAGLTRMEAESAFSLSLIEHETLHPQTVWQLKAGMLRKSGLLDLAPTTVGFNDLGGLDALKTFCTRALARHGENQVNARGVLLLGVPGTGKSAFAKAVGKETGRPTLTLDIGSLMGSLVGQTEQNIRRALAIADAMAPAILFCDEIEKALAGATGGQQGDSGVASRLFGSLLSWLNDHESDVFFVGTCNDISRLPPEFSRAERFDGVFFIDLPGTEEKRAIWSIYLARFGLDGDQALPDDTRWTGAEIRSCCRLAALLDLPLTQAAEHVVPVAVTAADSVQQLRQWARSRCLDAAQPGIYRGDTQSQTADNGTRRSIRRRTG